MENFVKNGRKRNRIHGYDYSQNNYYFVNVNTDESKYYFGKVEGGKMILNQYGEIVKQQLLWLKDQYPYVDLDIFVVMPNHVHVIIVINRNFVAVGAVGTSRDLSLRLPIQSDSSMKIKSLSELMGAFKTTSSKLIHQSGFLTFEWQRSFWDHVIRDERDLEIKRQYIFNNPFKWELDRNNFESKVPMKERGIW